MAHILVTNGSGASGLKRPRAFFAAPEPHIEQPIMNRVRLVIFNAALGPLDYRVPDAMEVVPGQVVVAPLGPRKAPPLAIAIRATEASEAQ